ncbi:MAG: transposase family protein [Chloroflexi bacterium]|nr:transposase family protein [Chloroflexota bacterium]
MDAKKEATKLPETSIITYFADMEDPRSGQNITHPLINIVTIAIFGVISGVDGWVDIERDGKAKQAWLSRFLDLTNGIPSHDTFGAFFAGWMRKPFKRVLSNGQRLYASRNRANESPWMARSYGVVKSGAKVARGSGW